MERKKLKRTSTVSTQSALHAKRNKVVSIVAATQSQWDKFQHDTLSWKAEEWQHLQMDKAPTDWLQHLIKCVQVAKRKKEQEQARGLVQQFAVGTRVRWWSDKDKTWQHGTVIRDKTPQPTTVRVQVSSDSTTTAATTKTIDKKKDVQGKKQKEGVIKRVNPRLLQLVTGEVNEVAKIEDDGQTANAQFKWFYEVAKLRKKVAQTRPAVEPLSHIRHYTLKLPLQDSFRQSMIDFCREADVRCEPDAEGSGITVGESQVTSLSESKIKVVQSKPVHLPIDPLVRLATQIDEWTAQLGEVGVYLFCSCKPGATEWDMTLAKSKHDAPTCVVDAKM